MSEEFTIEEIKKEFGDCDFMRLTMNTWTVDAIRWMIDQLSPAIQQADSPDQKCWRCGGAKYAIVNDTRVPCPRCNSGR